ncbi:hypothetical protein D3C78_675900 [compost metagenome]
MSHRQHGNIRFGVLLFAVNGQRPKMRWRPGENDQYQQQRLSADMAADRHPAQQRWRCAGQPPDHNVLRRRPFEKPGVDHRVAEQRSKGQPSSEGVGEHQQQGHTRQRQQQGKNQRRHRCHPAFGQRPFVSTGHQRINAPIHHMIDRRGAASAASDTEVAEQQHGPWHPGARGEEHAHQRGDQHQHHHLGLGQLQVIAPTGLQPALA